MDSIGCTSMHIHLIILISCSCVICGTLIGLKGAPRRPQFATGEASDRELLRTKRYLGQVHTVLRSNIPRRHAIPPHMQEKQHEARTMFDAASRPYVKEQVHDIQFQIQVQRSWRNQMTEKTSPEYTLLDGNVIDAITNGLSGNRHFIAARVLGFSNMNSTILANIGVKFYRTEDDPVGHIESIVATGWISGLLVAPSHFKLLRVITGNGKPTSWTPPSGVRLRLHPSAVKQMTATRPTRKPELPIHHLEIRVSIKLRQHWQAFFVNMEAPSSRLLCGNLENAMDEAFVGAKTYLRSEAVALRESKEGLVVADVDAKFTTHEDQAVAMLQREVATGKIGSIPVDPDFFEAPVIQTAASATKPSNPSSPSLLSPQIQYIGTYPLVRNGSVKDTNASGTTSMGNASTVGSKESKVLSHNEQLQLKLLQKAEGVQGVLISNIPPSAEGLSETETTQFTPGLLSTGMDKNYQSPNASLSGAEALPFPIESATTSALPMDPDLQSSGKQQQQFQGFPLPSPPPLNNEAPKTVSTSQQSTLQQLMEAITPPIQPQPAQNADMANSISGGQQQLVKPVSGTTQVLPPEPKYFHANRTQLITSPATPSNAEIYPSTASVFPVEQALSGDSIEGSFILEQSWHRLLGNATSLAFTILARNIENAIYEVYRQSGLGVVPKVLQFREIHLPLPSPAPTQVEDHTEVKVIVDFYIKFPNSLSRNILPLKKSIKSGDLSGIVVHAESLTTTEDVIPSSCSDVKMLRGQSKQTIHIIQVRTGCKLSVRCQWSRGNQPMELLDGPSQEQWIEYQRSAVVQLSIKNMKDFPASLCLESTETGRTFISNFEEQHSSTLAHQSTEAFSTKIRRRRQSKDSRNILERNAHYDPKAMRKRSSNNEWGVL